MKKLKDLPREYFHEIENNETKSPNPKHTLVLLLGSLFFSCMGILFSYNYGEPSFSLFLSIGFVLVELLLIFLLIILMIFGLWRRKKKLFLLVTSATCTLITYSLISPVLALLQMEYVPSIFLFLVLLFFPIGIVFQMFIIRQFAKAIREGKFLPGGEGLFNKKTMTILMPRILSFVVLLEGSRLTLIIWSRLSMRLFGNIVGVILLPFIALILVLTFSIVTAIYYLEVYCTFSLPDWGTPQTKEQN